MFYETPFGNLTLDRQIIGELYDTHLFATLANPSDEKEHSLEMHFPYIKHVMKDREFTIVPIVVGSMKKNSFETYAEILAPYFNNEENFFIISSDFCHWGSRFRYTHYNKNDGKIYESISKLDRMGMDLIESLNPEAFQKYLSEYKNTICGRDPITLLLNIIKFSDVDVSLKFTHYAQSSKCTTLNDSSVSYASAIVFTQ